ncbi:hypothetical protein [Streptomyces sp. NPDC001070]
MKTGTVKTLGAAALGVAFVGAAAGVASAAPTESNLGLPDASALPASVPVADVAKSVPVGAVAGGLPKTANVVPGVQNTPTGLSALLGGLPAGGQLPLGQLPLQGLPIGH